MTPARNPSALPGRPAKATGRPGPEAGGFHAYAVTSATGPHVTLQAATVHLGRHWTTATRGSVKARVVRTAGWASATAPTSAGWEVIGGPAVILDLAHPTTLARDVIASGLVGGALLRLGLGSLGQLVGYAEAAKSVPIGFLPVGRVVLAIRICEELIIDRDLATTVRRGWRGQDRDLTPAPHPALPGQTAALLDEVPAVVAELAQRAGGGWLGVRTARGAVALPAVWDPAGGRASVSRSALAAIGGEVPGAVCVTLDDSRRRRPDEKVGVMLRGTGSIVDLDRTTVSVEVAVRRVSYWSGFSSRTAHGAA